MEDITISDILEATGGHLLCGSKELHIQHLSIDSRTMKGNDLFVPLIGEKVNAHRFIEAAFSAGAAATFTSEHDHMPEDGHTWIRVEDTKKALQEVAAYYRRRLKLPLVGITGSVGKTTTREMVAAALSAGYRVYKTPANHNSQVGVPLTISGIGAEDEIGVLELGMSEPGEMTVIAGIAQVDAAVITNIGVTHIEQLGSKERIHQEKMNIQDGLKAGGTLYLNGDDKLLLKSVAKPGCRTVYYGTGTDFQYYAKNIRMERGCPVFTAVCNGKEIPVRLSVMGRHNILNAMASLAVADGFQVPLDLAAQRLSECHGFKSRQQVYQAQGITIIDDTYNASPISMKAGIEVLSSVETEGRRIAVLADMKELGAESLKYHREIGTYLLSHKVDILFTVGDQAGEIATAFETGGGRCEIYRYHADERSIMTETLKTVLKSGDCVLLKGSNSMKLTEVARALLEQIGGK